MIKKLLVLLEILSLILVIIPNGSAQKKDNIISFSTSSIEFAIDSFEKEYIQYIDATVNIDDESWEVYCELDITGIPRERILVAQGITFNKFSFSPFIKAIRLGVGRGKTPVILPRISIKYIPSWEDKSGTYQGRLILTYKSRDGFVPLAQLPVIIDIKPIFSVSICTESKVDKRKIQFEKPKCNNGPNITFLVPKPGEWESLEIIWLTIRTNYSRWNIQCIATDLIDTASKSKVIKTIPASYLYVKIGSNPNYIQLSNGYKPIISGSSGGVIGPIAIRFKLRTDTSVLAGEYSGNVSFLFGGM